jgi:hypothetical protein
MAVSDELAKLAIRAKQAEEHAAEAQVKEKADLQQEVETARASAQTQAKKLREKTDTEHGRVSASWHDAQQAWNRHIASAHEKLATKKAGIDATRAKRSADDAETEALLAIEWAFAAVDEAESATLDASLARLEANELAGATAGS